MRLRPVFFALPGILTLGCATAARQPAATADVSAGANIPRPAPPRIVPSVPRDSVAEADRVPAFAPRPLMTWGPLPAGEVQADIPLTYDLQHQVVRVRFDWSRRAVVGSTTLRVAALDTALRVVSIDAVGMTIARVTSSTGRTLKHTYDGNMLTVQLAQPLAAKKTTEITVDYEAINPKKGAYFIDRRHVVWTQGETRDTRRWIPTNDRPDDKTTWEIRVVTDTNERALSNGRLVSSKRVRDGGQPGIEWRWLQDKPASTYLMSAVTGAYTVIADSAGDTPVGYWTYPDSVDAGRRGFSATPAAVALFERLTGVAYPWAKYDQSVVPDFIYGGMENVSATTQNDDAILHPAWAKAHSRDDALVAHELAHQWYGDLLTTRSWPHIWLNEGFATFMESMFIEYAKGADEGALDRLDGQTQTIEADRRARRPIVYNRWKDDPIELFFSGHIYPKGMTILHMLRHQLGDSLFWKAMNRYTTTHAYGNVVTEDLRAAFEQATGRNFQRFFAQWVYGAGFPVYQVTSQYDAASHQLTISAKEVQTRDSLTGTFDADVMVEALTDSGAVRGTVMMRDGAGQTTLTLPAAPRSIRWNKGRWILSLADFPRSTNMLAYQLGNDDDVLGRYEAIDLLQPRLTQDAAVAAFVDAATSDKFWGIRRRALDALTAARAAGERVRTAYVTATSDTDPRVREGAVIGLSRFPGADTPALLERIARSDSSLIVRGNALAAYLAVAGDAGLPLAEEIMAVASWKDVLRKPALDVLARMSSARAQALHQKYAPPSR